MTVAQLIKKLQELPQDMPVAVYHEINQEQVDNPNSIEVSICTWIHSNWPYEQPDFDYVNLE